MAYDLTGDLVVLEATDYSNGIFKTIQKLNSDIQTVASKHNSLDKDTQDALNDLQNQIDNLSGGDINEIKKKVEALKELLGEDDTANKFLDVIDVVNELVEAINSIKKTETFEYLFNSESGELTVDLTSFDFKSKEDYDILVSLGDFKPVILNTQKVDEKTSKIVARDMRHFAELDVKYTDAGKKDDNGNYTNAFPITIIVSFDKDLVNEKVGRTPTER